MSADSAVVAVVVVVVAGGGERCCSGGGDGTGRWCYCGGGGDSVGRRCYGGGDQHLLITHRETHGHAICCLNIHLVFSPKENE